MCPADTDDAEEQDDSASEEDTSEEDEEERWCWRVEEEVEEGGRARKEAEADEGCWDFMRSTGGRFALFRSAGEAAKSRRRRRRRSVERAEGKRKQKFFGGLRFTLGSVVACARGGGGR